MKKYLRIEIVRNHKIGMKTTNCPRCHHLFTRKKLIIPCLPAPLLKEDTFLIVVMDKDCPLQQYLNDGWKLLFSAPGLQ